MWFLLPTPRNAPRAVRGAWAALGQLHGEADPCFWKVPYKISLCGKTSLRGPPSRSRGARSPGPVVRLAPAFPAGSPGAVKTTDPESPRSGSSPRTWVRPPAGPSGPARRRYRARARLPPGAGRPLPPARGRLAGPGTRRAPRPHTRAFRPELAAGFPEPPGGRGATAEENGRSAHRTFQGPGRRPGPELPWRPRAHGGFWRPPRRPGARVGFRRCPCRRVSPRRPRAPAGLQRSVWPPPRVECRAASWQRPGRGPQASVGGMLAGRLWQHDRPRRGGDAGPGSLAGPLRLLLGRQGRLASPAAGPPGTGGRTQCGRLLRSDRTPPPPPRTRCRWPPGARVGSRCLLCPHAGSERLKPGDSAVREGWGRLRS